MVRESQSRSRVRRLSGLNNRTVTFVDFFSFCCKESLLRHRLQGSLQRCFSYSLEDLASRDLVRRIDCRRSSPQELGDLDRNSCYQVGRQPELHPAFRTRENVLHQLRGTSRASVANGRKVASSIRRPYNGFGLQNPRFFTYPGGETASTGLQGGRCVPRTMASLKIWN